MRPALDPLSKLFGMYTRPRLRLALAGVALLGALGLTGCYSAGGNGVSSSSSLTPTIQTQPQDATVPLGYGVTFSVAGSGAPAPTYQWQRSNNGGSTWTDLAGATGTSYSLANCGTSDNNAQFRAVLTDLAGSAASRAATLTVSVTKGATQQVASLAPASVPLGIATGPDGNLWFTNSGQGQVGKLDALTHQVSLVSLPNPACKPVGITSGPDGNLWFTEQVGGKVGALTTKGILRGEYAVGNGPTGVVAGGDGNLWFTLQTDNKIGRITTAGAVTTYSLPSANASPSGITKAADGSLWFTEQAAGIIGRITAAGAITEFAAQAPAGGVTPTPVGITATPDGSIWYSDPANNCIAKFPTAAQVQSYPAARGTLGARRAVADELVVVVFYPLGGGANPNGLTTDASGNVWVTESGTSSVAVITVTTPAGTTPASYAVTDNGQPAAIVQGSDGNMYVTQPGTNDVVLVVSAPPVTTTTTTGGVTTTTTPVVVAVSPGATSLYGGGMATFQAVVVGSPTTSVTWSVQEGAAGGTISATGTYTAPATAGTYHVVATANADNTTNAVALVTVTVPTISAITPAGLDVAGGGSATFTSTVTGLLDNSIAWTASDGLMGTLTGVWTAPNTPETVTITATSNAYPALSATTQTVVLPSSPVITGQPKSVTAPAGTTATFTVAATGTPTPTGFQWLVSTDGGKTFNTIPGATSASYTTGTLASANDQSQFAVVVSNGAGSGTANFPAGSVSPVTSAAALLTVTYAPIITVQPVNQVVNLGSTATFSVTAAADPAPSGYQWQVSTNGTTWVTLPGATQATWTTAPTTSADDGSLFRALVTNASGTTTSGSASLTINPRAPIISVQPVNLTVALGTPASFTAAATGEPTPAYQWQVSTDGGNAWTNVASAGTSGTYTLASTGVTDDGSLFRLVATSSTGSATSATAHLTVTYAPLITTAPVAQTVAPGLTATFSVAAKGEPAPTYQWQVSTDKGATWTSVTTGSGGTTTSYTTAPTTLANGASLYQVVVANSAGSTTSAPVTLTLSVLAPSINTQPANLTVAAGTPATFTVVATGQPSPSYQWQVSTDGGITWKPAAAGTGATTASYTTANTLPTDDGTLYQVLVSNSNGSALSASAHLTVDYAPVIVTKPADQSVSLGSTATFTVVAAGEPLPLAYQWQVYAPGATGWASVTAGSGGTTATYTAPAAGQGDNGTQFRVVVTNAQGSVTSTPANLLLSSQAPVITSQPVNANVAAGTPVTFSALATGVPAPSYQWQVLASGAGNWAPIPNATLATYTFTPAGTDDGSLFQVVAFNANGSATSSTAALTVQYLTLAPVANQAVAIGSAATFTVTATGNPAPTIYQWQSSSDGGATWAPVTSGTGSASASYTTTPTTALMNGTLFRVVVTSPQSIATSSSASLTVAYTAPSGLVYASSPAIYVVGTAIGPNTPSNAGGAVVSYTISPALPAGLSIDSASGIISGTPSAPASPTAYTVTATNPGGSTTAQVTLTVLDIPPSALAYTVNPATYITGGTITSNLPTHAGGAVVAYTVSPALPAGLSLNGGTGAISGTPTAVASTAGYLISASNSGGTTQTVLTLTVNSPAPSGLTYTTSTKVYTKGTAIPFNLPSLASGSATSFTVAPPLPAGLNLNTYSGIINGTPAAVAATATYTVTATNVTGSTTAVLTLTVIDVPPANLTYTPAGVVGTLNLPIASLTPLNSGGAVVSYAVSPALPPGLSLDAITGVIGGTPSALASSAGYTVTATNSGGSTTQVVSITVNDAVPTGLTYTRNPAVYIMGTPIAANSPSSGGGAVLAYAVSPALPSGLTLDPVTGTISGNPTAVAAPATYQVTASNSGGTSAPANLAIRVNPPAPNPLYFGRTTTVGTYYQVSATNSLGATSWTLASGSLPTGMTLNAATGTISGTATASGVFTATITACNSVAVCATVPVTLTVTPSTSNPLTASYPNVTGTSGSPLTPVAPTVAFGGPVVSANLAAGSTLPTGLVLDATLGVLSGTPSATGTSVVQITLANAAGAIITLPVFISVSAPGAIPLAVSFSDVFGTVGAPLAPVAPTATSGGPVTSAALVLGALPLDVTLDPGSGTLSGTPVSSLLGLPAYLALGNASGAQAEVVTRFHIATTTPSTTAVGSYANASGQVNTPLTLTPDVPNGATLGGATLYSGGLPPGLALDPSTGAITGTPTQTGTYDLTIDLCIANGYCTTQNLTLTILPQIPEVPGSTTLNFTTGQAIGLGPTSLGGPITGATVTAGGSLPMGVTLTSNGSVNFDGTTPVGAYGPFTVTYSNVSGSVTDSLSITILPSAPMTAVYTSAQTLNQGIPIVPVPCAVSYPTPGVATSFAVTSGALPVGLVLNADGSISGTPTVLGSGTFAVTATSATRSATTPAINFTVYPAPPRPLYRPSVSTVGTYFSVVPENAGGPITSATLVSGTLPAGINLDPVTGILSGSTTTPAAATLQVALGNVYGPAVTVPAFLSVISASANPLAATYPAMSAKVGTPFSAAPVVATLDPVVSAQLLGSGALPAGLALNPDGSITGTPSAGTVGAYPVTILLGNGSGGMASTTPVLVVSPSGSTTLVASYPGLTDGKVGTALSASPTGGPIASATVVVGWLPLGLTLDPGTGIISGTPLVNLQAIDPTILLGNASGGLRAQRASFHIDPATATGFVQVSYPALIGQVGTSYTLTPVTTGAPVVAATMLSGSLPPGVTLDPVTGILSGTPTASGTYGVQVSLCSSGGGCGFASPTLHINPAPPVASYGDVTLTQDSTLLPVSDTGGPINKATLVSGGLPPGMTLNTNNGTIFGAPTLAGVYTATIQDANAGGASPNATFTITVLPVVPMTVGIAPTSPLTAGTSFASQPPAVANGIPGVASTFQLSGNVPPGLTLNGDGSLSGTPTTPGEFTFTLTATSTNPFVTRSAQASATWIVTPSSAMTASYAPSLPILQGTGIGVLPCNFPFGIAGSMRSFAFGTGSQVPPGIQLSSTTGNLTGIPTTPGTYAFTVTIQDSDPANYPGYTWSTQALCTWTVLVAAPDVIYPPLTITAGAPLTVTPVNAGGQAASASAYLISLGGQPLPEGMTVNSDGSMAWPSPVAGVYPIIVSLANAGGSSAATFILTVNPANTVPLVASYAFANLTATGYLPPLPPTVLSGGPVVSATLVPGTFPPYLFYNYSGNPGLYFDSVTGTLSGTPAAGYSGTFQFLVTLANESGGQVTVPMVLAIDTPSASAPLTATYPPGFGTLQTNPPVFTTLYPSVTSSFPITSASLVSGALPLGLNLDPDGSLTGSPGAITGIPLGLPGTYPLLISLQDSAGNVAGVPAVLNLSNTGSAFLASYPPALTLPLNSSISLTPYQPDESTIANALTNQILEGALPPGLTFDPTTGILSGQPTAAGTYQALFQLTSGTGATQAVPVGINVEPTPPPFYVTVGEQFVSLPPEIAGLGTFSAYTSNTLPNGLFVNPDGSVTGSPLMCTSGSYLVMVQSTGTFGTGTACFTIDVANGRTVSAHYYTNTFTVGTNSPQAFSTQYIQLKNPPAGPQSFTLASGSLPPGLQLNADGSISATPGSDGQQGAPTTPGLYSFTVAATLGNVTVTTPVTTWTVLPSSTTLTASYTPSSPTVLEGIPMPMLSCAVNNATPGVPTYFQVNLSGLPTNGATWGLPNGLTLNPDGSISGVPTTPGLYQFSVQATNGPQSVASNTVTLLVTALSPLAVSYPSGLVLNPGQSILIHPGVISNVLGGTITYTADSLPPGLALATDGTLSGIVGTPTQSSYTFTVTATVDGIQATSTQTWAVSAMTASYATPASFSLQEPLNQPITVNNAPTGQGLAYAWSGTGPLGLYLNPTTGAISYQLTPPAAGSTATFQVQVTAGPGLVAVTPLASWTFNQGAGFLAPVTPMQAQRTGALASLLPDGKVLIAGGLDADSTPLSSTEIYDPIARTFSSAGPMTEARYTAGTSRQAVLLPNGLVVLSTETDGTLDIFDELGLLGTAGSFTSPSGISAGAGPGTAVTALPASTAMPTGAILFSGGGTTLDGMATASNAASIFNYVATTPNLAGVGATMTDARAFHTATYLPAQNSVLITGGTQGGGLILGSCELLNLTTQTFTSSRVLDSGVAPLQVPRWGHSAVALPNGNVLILGGEGTDGTVLNSAEIYNPGTGSCILTAGTMGAARIGCTATLQPDGTVLVSGGLVNSYLIPIPTSEVYNPATGIFTPVGSMSNARALADGVLLLDGTTLVAGGGAASAEIFEPAYNLSVPGGILPTVYNSPYSYALQAFDANPGTPSYNYQIISGQLPNGLTLSPTGQLTGTPMAPANGFFPVVVQVTDATSPNNAVGGASLMVTELTGNQVPAATTLNTTIGATFAGNLTAPGTGPFTWALTSAPDGATSVTLDGATFSGTSSAAGIYNLNFTWFDPQDQPGVATFQVVVADPPVVTLTQSPINAVQGQPVTLVANVGSPVGNPIATAYTFTRSDGLVLSGPPSSGSCTIPAVGPADVGYTYTCTVASAEQGVVAPLVTSPPYSLVVALAPIVTVAGTPLPATLGGAVTFNATVASSPGLYAYSYQWQENGRIVGTNAPTFTIPAVQTTDAGAQITCTVTNVVPGTAQTGVPVQISATSPGVTLTVNAYPPIIGRQPASQGVPLGSSANFSVWSNGPGPLTYQWQILPYGSQTFVNLPGATQSFYGTAPVQVTDDGTQFQVVVTNSAGSTTSLPATLSVTSLAPLLFVAEPTDQRAAPGMSLTFEALAVATHMSDQAASIKYQWQITLDQGQTWTNLVPCTPFGTATTANGYVSKGSTPNAVTLTGLQLPAGAPSASVRAQATLNLQVNPYGDLDTLFSKSAKITIVSPYGDAQVAAADNASFQILNPGSTSAQLMGSGADYLGQLGINDPLGQPQLSPVPVQFPTSVVNGSPAMPSILAVNAAAGHTLALDANNNVWWWGGVSPSQMGLAPQVITLSDPTPVVQLVNNSRFSFAVMNSGSVLYWNAGTSGTTSFVNTEAGGAIAAAATEYSYQGGPAVAMLNYASGTPIQVCQIAGGGFAGGNLYQGPAVLEGAVALYARYDSDLYVLMPDGSLWVWPGLNPAADPVRLAFPGACVALAKGNGFLLGIDSHGSLWAFGNNANGQLGQGDTAQHPGWVQIPGLNKVQAVAAGSSFAMAVDGSGTLWTWGFEGMGELGDGQSTALVQPAQVPNVPVNSWGQNYSSNNYGICWNNCFNYWPQVVTSSVDTFAFGNYPNQFLVWGTQGNLFLDGLGQPQTVPEDDTQGLLPYVQTLGPETQSSTAWSYANLFTSSLAQHILGVDVAGNLWAWGSNTSGQLGDGTLSDRSYPVLAIPAVNILGGNYSQNNVIYQAAAGSSHSLAVDSHGHVWSWGNNWAGQLGRTTIKANQAVPGLIGSGDGSLSNINQVAAGGAHSLALDYYNNLYAWGANDHGQAGTGRWTSSPTLVQFPTEGSTYISQVSAGTNHTLALDTYGNVWAWGANDHGQVGNGGFNPGDGQFTDVSTPRLVLPGGDGFSYVQIYAGPDCSLAVDSNGNLWAWGDNSMGLLGARDGNGNALGPVVPRPALVSGVSNVWSVSATATSVLATVQGYQNGPSAQFVTWGWNQNGLMGLGPDPVVPSPTQPGADGAHSLTVNVYPYNQTTVAGVATTFRAVVQGNPAPTLQWYSSDGSLIPGATGSTYTVVPSQDGPTGFYVIATNSLDTYTSNTVGLTLLPYCGPPLLDLFTANTTTIVDGGTVTLTFTQAGATNNNNLGTTSITDQNGNVVYQATGAGTGSVTVAPAASTTYTLTTSTYGSSTTSTVNVVVDPAQNAISGTVTAPNSGPVYITLDDGNLLSATSTQLGTCVLPTSNGEGYSANFTIVGATYGATYQVSAWQDAWQAGYFVTDNPFTSPVTTSVTVGSGDPITLNLVPYTSATPPPSTPAPVILSVEPLDGGLAVFFRPLVGFNNGLRGMTDAYNYYLAYWTPNQDGYNTIPIADPSSGWVLLNGYAHNLPNGTPIAVGIAAETSGGWTYSAEAGPVTLGAVRGPNTLTGTITLPPNVSSKGPLYVLVGDKATQTFRGTVIPGPSSSQPFTVTGIPNGVHSVQVFLDQNNAGQLNWVLEPCSNPQLLFGDYSNHNGEEPLLSFGGGTSSFDLTLPSADVSALVTTRHLEDATVQGPSRDQYGLVFEVLGLQKLPVAVRVLAGPNLAGPLDLAKDYGVGFKASVALGTKRPAVGDTYTLLVTFLDQSQETVTAAVTGLVDGVATSLNTNWIGNNNEYYEYPNYTWSAPAAPPALYSYTLRVDGDPVFWTYPMVGRLFTVNGSVPYNSDTLAIDANAGDVQFQPWEVLTYDAFGNASAQAGGLFGIFGYPASPIMISYQGANTTVYPVNIPGFGFQYTALSGLPPGWSLDPATGILSGPPYFYDGTWSIGVTASNGTIHETAYVSLEFTGGSGSGSGSLP